MSVSLIPTDLFTNALQAINMIGAAEVTPSAEDTELCRRALNRLVGQWNNRKRNCYFIQTASFTFPSTKQSYTIGLSTNVPAPDFALTAQDRPIAIEDARIVLTGSVPNVFLQLAVINFPQYQTITVPTISATIPNSLYYQPTVPNGTMFIWPEPTVLTNKLEIAWRNQLMPVTQPNVGLAVVIPDGYEEALTLTLAEKVWLHFPKRTDLAELSRQARIARADAFSNNQPPPKIDTTDGATHERASGFNWLTRLPG